MERGIGLDLGTFSTRNAGIGRYTINLVNQLIRNNSFFYTCFLSGNSDVSLLRDRKEIRLVSDFTAPVKSNLARSSFILPFQASLNNINLFHSMANNAVRRLPGSKYKRVCTIHDLIVYRFPGFFTRKHIAILRYLTSHAVKNSDHIIAVSNATKKDILNFFPDVDDAGISVTYQAPAPGFKKSSREQTERTLKRFDLPSKYFLSLATYEPRKNLKNLTAAFIEFKKRSACDDIALVLIGGTGWLESGISMDRETLKTNKILPLGFVDDEFLSDIYSGALAFVYPSLYEGFGLPVLEAMACGQAIITSDVSSLPEVAGDAAVYVDPRSIDSIVNAMKRLLDDDDLRSKLKEKSLQHVSRFSWEKTALQTEAVYKQLL